jgi:Ca-activated chloride channel family protein
MGMQQPRSNRTPFIIAGIVGIVLIILVRSLFNGGGGGSANPSAIPSSKGDPPCVQLNLTASSEKAALLKQIAADFVTEAEPIGGHCVAVAVTSKASGGAMTALARGWDEAVDGPRPDVWSPAASSWAVILQQRLAEQDRPNLVPSDVQHVAATPLVIAMPRPMGEALGWPSKPIGWSDILSLAQDPAGWGKFGHPEWGAFRLGKTNPNFSTSGLNATIGAYFAATGLSSDLGIQDVRDPAVRDFIKGVESSVVHYGDITLTFLSNLQRADDRGQGLSYISAVTIEEKSVWDYNQGNPTGDPKTLGDHAPPRTPLVAIYPKEGTLLSDNPYLVLTAPWVDDQKRQLAASFLAFLQQPDQQKRFQDFAFRDFEGHPGPLISQGNGLLPDEPKATLSPPSPPVLDEIQRSWTELRKRARVLLVIDVSGSMGDAVPESGSTKLDLAKSAAIKALDEFAPDDDVGLWIFSSEFPSVSTPYLELLPVAPLAQQLSQMKQLIGHLQPTRGTALYATARAATRVMQESFDPTRINAVVLLTDGKNEYPEDVDLDGLLRQLQSEDEDTAIRVFPIAYGEDADLGTLTKIAEASRAAVYNSADPASIDNVFTAVVSNF